MGLWPFGRAKADVESSSRVVVLRARDGVPMRAKITLRLEEPQTQATVDALTEQCADLVRLVVREAPSASAVLGLEGSIAAEVAARLPKDAAALRSIEIAGLHVVGDPGHLARPQGAQGDHHPAWLSAAPSPAPAENRISSLPLERPTPIHPMPAPRPPASGGPVSSARAPASGGPGSSPAASQGHGPRSVGSPGHAPPAPPAPPATPAAHAPPAPPAPPATPAAHAPQAASRPADPFASTAVSPVLFAPAARPSEPAHAAPTPHAGVPVTRRVHAGEGASLPAPHAGAIAGAPAHGAAGAYEHGHAHGTAGGHDHAHARPGSSRPPSGTMAAVGSSRPPSGTMAAVGSSRPPSGTMRAVGSSRPPSGTMTAVDEPSSPSRKLSGLGPPSAASPASVAPASRASSRPPPGAVAARRRVVAARLPLPTGAGPYEVARGLTPLFRDTAARVLVAFLRTYDLTVVRRVPFDAVEGDILSSLTAPSDGAPGTYAASHAAEIQRWRDAFGAATMDRLQREANLSAAALAFEGLCAEGVSQRSADAVVEGLAGAAFGDPDMIIELGRYLFPAHETMAAETLANMIGVAGEDMPPGMEAALEPLFASLREDVAAAALIARDVMTNV